MRKIVSAMLLAGSALAPAALHAQTGVEGRVQRLEGEMRAVQRKVFPGGSGQYVQPDNGPVPLQDAIPGTPASSPVADLTARLDSLENQLRTLTGQVETSQFRTQQLEGRIKALETAAASAPAAPSGIAPPDSGIAPARPSTSSSERLRDDPAIAGPRTADRPVPDRLATDRPADRSAAGRPAARATDPARAAKVAAVERPDTGDAAEDTYSYGYRLWAAKLYPEAEAQFLSVTTRYPAHRRASYAQNLLGRSYLDDGKPSLASLAFLDNYKKWPDGDRAPESLLYLAQALVTLDKPAAQVCKVYTELQRSYGAKVEADAKMKAAVAKGRAASSCS